MTSYYLLDVTRLVARCWKGNLPTGIDRVAMAYLTHFASRAQAVIQYRGIVRVLTASQSERLFCILQSQHCGMRWNLIRLLASILKGPSPSRDFTGKTYINVGHTDFDLANHWRWISANALRSVYMIHDLIPIRRPELTSPHATKRHKARVVRALSDGNGIITNSRSTLADLSEFARWQGIALPPTLPAKLGTDHLHWTGREAQVPASYFVCASTIEPRKNHLMLLRIWKRLIVKLGPNTPKLMLIGQWGYQADLVRSVMRSNAELARHVTVLTRCDDAEMVKWVRSAKAVLIPSLAEGYGLPLAEAMALGTPAIVSDLGCAKEIGNNVPRYIPSNDEGAWEREIISFLRDDSEAQRQRKLLAQHTPKTWAAHFRLVEDWLEDLGAVSCANRTGGLQNWERLRQAREAAQ